MYPPWGGRNSFARAQAKSHLFPTDEERRETAQAWVKERNRLLARHNEHRKDHGLQPMPAERAHRFVQPPSELEAYIFSRYRYNNGFISPLNDWYLKKRGRDSAQAEYYELLTEAYGDAEEWEKVYADQWAKLFKAPQFGRGDERRNIRPEFYNDDDEDDDIYGEEDRGMPRGMGEPVDGAGGFGGGAGMRVPPGMRVPGGMGPDIPGVGFGAGFGGGKRRGRR